MAKFTLVRPENQEHQYQNGQDAAASDTNNAKPFGKSRQLRVTNHKMTRNAGLSLPQAKMMLLLHIPAKRRPVECFLADMSFALKRACVRCYFDWK
jgi:hypothetical protein